MLTPFFFFIFLTKLFAFLFEIFDFCFFVLTVFNKVRLDKFNINSNIIWTLSGLIFFENIHQYLVVMYRSRQKFNLLSRIIYFQSFFLFFIVGFLVWTYGLIGYIGGMAVALSLTVLVFFIYDKAIFRFHVI